MGHQALFFDIGRSADDRPESLRVLLDIVAPIAECCPSRPEIVACAVRLKMRVRRTSSKPFMTDSTTISTATPEAKPTMAMPAIKDTKPRRGDARR